MELLYLSCSPYDAPAKKSIEFHARPPACFKQIAHIKCLGQGYHRHRRGHPHFKCLCPGCIFWIYFSFHAVKLDKKETPPKGCLHNLLLVTVFLSFFLCFLFLLHCIDTLVDTFSDSILKCICFFTNLSLYRR